MPRQTNAAASSPKASAKAPPKASASAKKQQVTYVVLGGAGAMGRITARDLAETSGKDVRIRIADYHLDKARELGVTILDEAGLQALLAGEG